MCECTRAHTQRATLAERTPRTHRRRARARSGWTSTLSNGKTQKHTLLKSPFNIMTCVLSADWLAAAELHGVRLTWERASIFNVTFNAVALRHTNTHVLVATHTAIRADGWYCPRWLQRTDPPWTKRITQQLQVVLTLSWVGCSLLFLAFQISKSTSEDLRSVGVLFQTRFGMSLEVVKDTYVPERHGFDSPLMYDVQ